jgi:hypothetical protein
MSTDRFVYQRYPCDCGAGEYIIYHCSHDDSHKRSSYAAAEWYELSISCEACFNSYAQRTPIMHENKSMRKVRQEPSE